MIPGEYFLASTPIVCNVDRETIVVSVVNHGDRPVQIGSHFHFFEVNPQLSFERDQALGMRLYIPAGTAVRFEPGESKKVTLVAYAGKKKVMGFNSLVNGKDIVKGRKGILKKVEKFSPSK